MTAALQQQEPSYSDPVAHAFGTPEEQRSAAASHLAHDARNWLTVLQVYCDLLRSSGAVAGHGRTWIDELSNAVERGQGLVTSLLDCGQNFAPLGPLPCKKGGRRAEDAGPGVRHSIQRTAIPAVGGGHDPCGKQNCCARQDHRAARGGIRSHPAKPGAQRHRCHATGRTVDDRTRARRRIATAPAGAACNGHRQWHPRGHSSQHF